MVPTNEPLPQTAFRPDVCQTHIILTPGRKPQCNLKHNRSRGFFAAGMVWFYEVVKILPFREDDENMIHCTYSTGRPQFVYSIFHYYLAVLTPSTNFTTQIHLPRDIAYDTTGRLMFEQQQCMVQNRRTGVPILLWANLEYFVTEKRY